jgi:hypothetical protein
MPRIRPKADDGPQVILMPAQMRASVDVGARKHPEPPAEPQPEPFPQPDPVPPPGRS